MTQADPGEADAEPWRRPSPEYDGPPAMIPPPPSWRPPTIIEAPPPRELPTQDVAAIDADERSARTLTYGIAMVSAGALAVVFFILCARLIT